MFEKRRSLAVVSAALLIWCAVPAGAQPTFVGFWYSANQPDEPDVMSMIEFRTDGTFHEEFRKCENGDVVGYQFESGRWSVSDDVEFLVVDEVNGDAARITARYTIELLTDKERRIRMDPEGLLFISHRVSKFEFPACPSVL